MICFNARFRFNTITGVERYAHEVGDRLAQHLSPVGPSGPRNGIKGHAWEQFVLPGRVGKRLLWSPCNTGPLAVCRQVVTIHDMSALDHPEWMSRKFAAWYGFLLPRLARRCRLVLTDSLFSRARIVERCGVPPEKVVAIPLAASAHFQPASDAAVAELCRELEVTPGRYLLSVSSIEPRKNLVRLLKAWQLALPRLPDDAWLVLSGKLGESRVFADAGLSQMPAQVKVTGYMPYEKLPALYSGAAFFVYVSLYEGFGLPLLEAMACGTPVISSDRASLPEVVGTAGHIVDPMDAEAVADALVAAFDPAHRAALARGAQAHAQQFSWDRAAAQTWEALKSVT